MEVLEILSRLWRAGAEIYRDKSDGRLVMKNADKIPPPIMQLAEQFGNEIDKWVSEFERMSVEDKTMFKIHAFIAGWQPNPNIEKFLNSDYQAIKLWYEWSVILATNGYTSIYEDYRQFENEQSNQLKKQIYERAVVFNKQSK